MSESRLTRVLAVVTKKLKWPENKSVGYEAPESKDKYLNPLLTPLPKSPSSPEDFRFPQRLGHWRSYGFDHTDPLRDKWMMHEFMIAFFIGLGPVLILFNWAPDYNYAEWGRREAFLRTAKREALGLPLIDRNVIDPERMVLPTEEELGDFEVTM